MSTSWSFAQEIAPDASEIPILEDENFWNSALGLSQLDQYYDPFHFQPFG
jgi:hypothetical protein